MPFTFAHPAAVLPLRGRFKSLQTVPLIVGSVAPDLPYFIPVRFNRPVLDTHTFQGVFWFDLPIGMAVLLFGFVFRRPLTALLSPRARALCLQSVQHFRDQPMHWIWAPFAIIVGAWTHLLWDSFTHDNGWVVKRVAALSAPITLGGWYTGSVCHVLQYVSSIAGLLILWIWFRRLPTPPLESPAPGTLSSSTRTVIFLMVCVAGAALGGYRAISVMLGGTTYYRVIYVLLTRATAWFALLYFIAGVFVNFSSTRSRKPEPVAEET
jgi:preprotein translocase subunit SecG